MVLCANSQPFCPGLGKGDEGRSHPGLLVKDLQQAVPITTVPSQVLAEHGDNDPVKSGTCGWVGGSASLWSRLLELFNQLFHSDYCTGWQLLESGRGDIC